MLSGHSRIHIPPETWFIADLARDLPLTGRLTPAQVAHAVAIMTAHYRWPDMQIPAEEFQRWAIALRTPTLVGIINLMYDYQLRLHGKRRFGDKTPPYIHSIPEILTLYPDAKFIHLIRDGRDVAISYVEMESMRCYDPDFYWTLAMRRRRTYLNSSYAGQILEVKYEDLVTSPEPTLRSVCGFLEEEFEPGMLNWQPLTDLVPERERAIHRRLAEPLRQEAIGVWQRKLSRWECFAIESCLQRDLRRLGYPLRFSGTAWRPFLVASGVLISALAPILTRAIPYLQRRNYLPRTLHV